MAENDSLRCMALPLKGGDLCLFNPVNGLSGLTLAKLGESGTVKYLLSPNHYHNKALRSYCDQFEGAIPCASTKAGQRLRKITGLKVARLAGLTRKLHASMDVIHPVGLKTGEIWLRIRTRSDVAWLVGDAYCGPASKKGGSFTATPQLLATFPKFGIGDRRQYVNWVKAQVEEDQPSTVVPCHGGIIRSQQLPQKLIRLLSGL